MKVKKTALANILTLLILLTVASSSLAQGAPQLIIHGSPDAKTAAPQVRTCISVINKDSAKSIDTLTGKDFQLEEASTPIDSFTVSYEPLGLAVIVVIDRGGISVPDDPRITEATGLVRDLVDNRLTVEGKNTDDIIALIGVAESGPKPIVDFAHNPVDTNLIKNALVTIEGQRVKGGTPLYEGLDEALRLLTANTSKEIRDVLAHRRKVIIVLSDGIDPDYSDEARETDVINKAQAADISLYTIGMARRDSNLKDNAKDNLMRLAHQTNGLYQLHNNDKTHQQVLDMFERLMTQRNQYLLSYNTRRPKGDYSLNVMVDTSIGSAEEKVQFSSILETPQIRLTAPNDGFQVTVPYSNSLKSFLPTAVTLQAQISPPDGVSRYPAMVRYFANGGLAGTSTVSPDFVFIWDVTTIVTPTEKTQSRQFTLKASAEDAYLGTGMTSQPINITVTWEKKPPPPPTPTPSISEKTAETVRTNWWIIIILLGLLIGLVVLSILLFRTRGELARKVVTGATGVLKGVTRRLGAEPKRAPGKLVVIQGANMGQEYRLTAHMVKIGRDPQFCDFALHDEYASNPHFSIQMEQTQFFVTDMGSTNGTRLNGVPLQPNQRMLLQPDAIIKVGQTQLQFKRIGGTTRQLDRARRNSPGTPPPPPPRPMEFDQQSRESYQQGAQRGGPTQPSSQ